MNACVLVTVETGSITETVNRIKEIEHVHIVFPSFGQWDIVVWLKTEDFLTLTRNALQINNLASVVSTESLIELTIDNLK
jgi:uncharacterized protein with GYD domain